MVWTEKSSLECKIKRNALSANSTSFQAPGDIEKPLLYHYLPTEFLLAKPTAVFTKLTGQRDIIREANDTFDKRFSLFRWNDHSSIRIREYARHFTAP